MRQVVLVVALLVQVPAAGCTFGDSDAYKLKARIGRAQGELMSQGPGDLSFTHSILIDRPFVVVVLPAERVSKETVQAAQLPLEAKELIQSHIEHSDLPGAVLGLVEADKSEWHPLPDGVSVSEMLYAWKQPGEGVAITMTRRDGTIAIAGVR